ncbi:MAG: hypothetical protein GY861_12815 [bacterium]|nr:hypothetical protein [bacterium]
MKSISEAKWKVQVNSTQNKKKWWWYMETDNYVGECTDIGYEGNTRVSPTYKSKAFAEKKLHEYLKINKITNYEVVE